MCLIATYAPGAAASGEPAPAPAPARGKTRAAKTEPLSPSAISRRSAYSSRGSSVSLMNPLSGATTAESQPG